MQSAKTDFENGLQLTFNVLNSAAQIYLPHNRSHYRVLVRVWVTSLIAEVGTDCVLAVKALSSKEEERRETQTLPEEENEDVKGWGERCAPPLCKGSLKGMHLNQDENRRQQLVVD